MVSSHWRHVAAVSVVLCIAFLPCAEPQNLNALLEEGECKGGTEWGNCSVNPATGVCERTGSRLSRTEGGERCFTTETCVSDLECRAQHLLTRAEQKQLRRLQRKRNRDARANKSENEISDSENG